MLSSFYILASLFFSFGYAFISNVPELQRTGSALGMTVKTPADLLFSGPYVCEKFSSIIQSTNNTDGFPVNFNLYVAVDENAPNDNYTVDMYFKNPYHNSLNDFAMLNVSDSKHILQHYNAKLISRQPGFGVEFKFSFAKGLLCNFLYEFTVAYQLERQSNTTETSDKIFLVGSCQLHKNYYPESHQELVKEGFRCVEYNSGFRYDGGKDWCYQFYPQDECCKTYRNDELVARGKCPPGSNSTSSTNSTDSAYTAHKQPQTTLSRSIVSNYAVGQRLLGL